MMDFSRFLKSTQGLESGLAEVLVRTGVTRDKYGRMDIKTIFDALPSGLLAQFESVAMDLLSRDDIDVKPKVTIKVETLASKEPDAPIVYNVGAGNSPDVMNFVGVDKYKNGVVEVPESDMVVTRNALMIPDIARAVKNRDGIHFYPDPEEMVANGFVGVASDGQDEFSDDAALRMKCYNVHKIQRTKSNIVCGTEFYPVATTSGVITRENYGMVYYRTRKRRILLDVGEPKTRHKKFNSGAVHMRYPERADYVWPKLDGVLYNVRIRTGGGEITARDGRCSYLGVKSDAGGGYHYDCRVEVVDGIPYVLEVYDNGVLIPPSNDLYKYFVTRVELVFQPNEFMGIPVATVARGDRLGVKSDGLMYYNSQTGSVKYRKRMDRLSVDATHAVLKDVVQKLWREKYPLNVKMSDLGKEEGVWQYNFRKDAGVVCYVDRVLRKDKAWSDAKEKIYGILTQKECLINSCPLDETFSMKFAEIKDDDDRNGRIIEVRKRKVAFEKK